MVLNGSITGKHNATVRAEMDLVLDKSIELLVGTRPIDRVTQAECDARHAQDATMQPMIVKDGCAGWDAENWTEEQFRSDFGDATFMVHSSTEDSAPMAVSDFMDNHAKASKNAKVQYDSVGTEDPLYLFETLIGGKDGNGPSSPAHLHILNSYTDPIPDRLDMLRLSNEGSRPGYRWLLLGGRGSGTKLHIDPFGTSAWNALLFGAKRWVLFPPNTPQKWIDAPGTALAEMVNAGVGPDATLGEEAALNGSSGASGWFGHVWPRYRESAEELPEHLRPISCVQMPGEIIYVPLGWYHTVINIELSVAFTENYADPRNYIAVRRGLFGNLWGSLEHLDSACDWNAAVDRVYPGLVQPNSCVLCDAETIQRISLLNVENGGRVVCHACAEATSHYHGVLSAADAYRWLHLSHSDDLQELPSLWHKNVRGVLTQYFMRAHLHELAEEVHGSVQDARALARDERGAKDDTDEIDNEAEKKCVRNIWEQVFYRLNN